MLALKKEFIGIDRWPRKIVMVRLMLADGRYYYSIRSQRLILGVKWVCEYSTSHNTIESAVTDFLIVLMFHKEGNGYSHSVYKENRLNAMSA